MSERLIRPLVELKFAGETPDEAGRFEGYGAVFGNIDAYGDVIAKGAFRDTLREWKRKTKLPPMLLQHAGGWMGSANDLVPIGVWEEMREDETGLYVKGRLIALDTDRGRSTYAAMKAGALDGLSIGYLAKKFDLGTKPDEPRRTLKAVELVEVSVVTFPANPEARVDGIKSGVEMTEREFEHFLRDAGGFTREQAKTIVAKGYRLTRRDAMPSEESLSALADGLKGLLATVTGDGNGNYRSQGAGRVG